MLTAVAFGCASTSKQVIMERNAKYQRIALVCAAAPGHDTSYASMVLKQAEPRVPSRLGRYIERADCLYDVPVDTTTKPPKVDLGKRVSDYDGVVCMVYSWSEMHVFLDFDMVDVKSGESVWHFQLDEKDPSVRNRLTRHGLWAPTIVKQYFYEF